MATGPVATGTGAGVYAVFRPGICHANGIPGECGDCRADVDRDGRVSFADVVLVLVGWRGSAPGCVPEDIRPDGRVDFDDLMLVLGTFGPCP